MTETRQEASTAISCNASPLPVSGLTFSDGWVFCLTRNRARRIMMGLAWIQSLRQRHPEDDGPPPTPSGGVSFDTRQRSRYHDAIDTLCGHCAIDETTLHLRGGFFVL